MYISAHPLSRDLAGEFLAMDEDAQRQHLRTRGGMTEDEIDLRLPEIKQYAIMMEEVRAAVLQEDEDRKAQIVAEVIGS